MNNLIFNETFETVVSSPKQIPYKTLRETKEML